jgi:type III secretion system (T3SS) inner membrane Yop/YscD-like protein
VIVTCSGCSRRYNFDLAKLAGRPSARLRCPHCSTMISVTAADPGDQTTRLDQDANLLSKAGKVPQGDLSMPGDKRLSLAVLQGKDSGRIFLVDKPRMVLGRGDGDIVLNDSEVSRQHAAIEVHGGRVVLKDLGSTNGIFVNDVKVSQAEIDNRAEFRLGGTRLMLIMTDITTDLETLE